MDSRKAATINFDAQVHLENRGDYWAAYIEPPGTTVYGATEAAARERVGEVLDFFVDSDDAVAVDLKWDAMELGLLHQEPHVRGLGYGQYADAVEVQPADRARFTELADQWEQETVLLSNSAQAAAHPAHRQIVSMGEPVVPLILERMRSQGGHWFHALGEITGAAPVAPGARGDIAAMQQAWLDWGGRNGVV